jgi:hypothetical protein
MALLAQIVFDWQHPAALARFWAAALDGYAVRPYDEAELERLASLGHTADTDPFVLVDGPGVELRFQQVPVEDVGKNRVHLDLDAADRDAEVARLVALGAQVRQRFEGHTWLVDPEGNDLCVVQDDAPGG